VEYIPKDAFSYTVLEETLRQLLDLEEGEPQGSSEGG
jgi:hypothetical protein